jgi:hypothetical protein
MGLGGLFMLASACAQPSPQISTAPVAGPVDLSVGREAYAALSRAEAWLAAHPTGEKEDAPAPATMPVEMDLLLPLLAGESIPHTEDALDDYHRLALALAARGQPTVFLADDRPVIWKEALLRQVVVRQKIDGQGHGFWRNPDAAASDLESTRRSTRRMVETLAFLLTLP